MWTIYYLDSCFWCKKDAEVVIFSRHTCHGIADRVVGEWGVSGPWLLGHISTLVWEQEEVWTTWLLNLRVFIQNTWEKEPTFWHAPNTDITLSSLTKGQTHVMLNGFTCKTPRPTIILWNEGFRRAKTTWPETPHPGAEIYQRPFIKD